MDVGRGDAPIIPLIGVSHCLSLSPETLSPPLASTDLGSVWIELILLKLKTENTVAK